MGTLYHCSTIVKALSRLRSAKAMMRGRVPGDIVIYPKDRVPVAERRVSEEKIIIIINPESLTLKINLLNTENLTQGREFLKTEYLTRMKEFLGILTLRIVFLRTEYFTLRIVFLRVKP